MGVIRKFVFTLFTIFNGIILKMNRVQYGKIVIEGIVLVHNKGTFRIADRAKINSSRFKNIIGGDTRCSFVIKKNASLTIGENFKISNSAIYCAEKIEIGDNVMIGGSCKVWDSDFHPLNHESRLMNPNEEYVTRPIRIHNNVFIGGCSIVLKGVTIGEGSIVGAGSVVSRDIPAGEIWAGNPAVFIKRTT